jgi:hypothetical protein
MALTAPLRWSGWRWTLPAAAEVVMPAVLLPKVKHALVATEHLDLVLAHLLFWEVAQGLAVVHGAIPSDFLADGLPSAGAAICMESHPAAYLQSLQRNDGGDAPEARTRLARLRRGVSRRADHLGCARVRVSRHMGRVSLISCAGRLREGAACVLRWMRERDAAHTTFEADFVFC